MRYLLTIGRCRNHISHISELLAGAACFLLKLSPAGFCVIFAWVELSCGNFHKYLLEWVSELPYKQDISLISNGNNAHTAAVADNVTGYYRTVFKLRLIRAYGENLSLVLYFTVDCLFK